MSLALIRLFLGGALKKLVGLLGRFFGSLNAQGWIGLVACGVLAFLFIRAEGESRHWHKQSDRFEKLYAADHSGRIADRKSYTDAQATATEINKHQIERTKRQQEAITDEVKSTLSARLELIRGELRRSGAQGSSGSAPASDPGAAPCRAIDPAWLCLSPEARLSAAESEERHDELIDWVTAQSKVNPNKP